MPAIFLLLFILSGLQVLPAAPVTACSSVTHDEVQQVIGRNIGKGMEENGKTESTCEFEGKTGLVTVAIHNVETMVNFEAQQKDLRTALPGALFRTASAGNAQGFVASLPDAGAQLHLQPSPRKYIIVTVLGFGGTSEAARSAQSIGEIVASRIGQQR